MKKQSTDRPGHQLETMLLGPSPWISIDRMGDGPPVVFLHGVGGNKHNWRENLPIFADRFTAIAWDARGYGCSDDYAGKLEFSDFSHDLMRVIATLGFEKVHLVGLSMGSWIAMDFWVHYPNAVRSLTLCCTHSGFSMLSDKAKAEFVRSRRQPLESGLEPCDIAEPVAAGLVSPKAPRPVIDKLVESISALHKESYIKAMEALVDTDYRAHLPRVQQPCLVIAGADDTLTTPEMAREVARLVPSARLKIIQNAGHLPNIEKPEAFNRAVLDFLLEIE